MEDRWTDKEGMPNWNKKQQNPEDVFPKVSPFCAEMLKKPFKTQKHPILAKTL